jgi:hypothetical protein
VSRQDPKHGRWILPLIIAAMVVLTYTFVNSLEPAEQVDATDTTTVPPFPTVPTTTTTLPADTQAFLVTLDAFESQVLAYLDEVNLVNDQWEAREIEFNEAATGFEQIRASISSWEDDVAQAADPTTAPEGLGEPLVQLLIDVEELAPGVEDIVLGLRAPDDGTLRRDAVAQFTLKIQSVIDAIDEIRELAGPQEAEDPTDTTGDDGTDTTTGDGVDA